MAKGLIATLLAAAALLPGVAVAQDRGSDRGGRFDRPTRSTGESDAARMQRAQQQAPTRNWQPIRSARQGDAGRQNGGWRGRPEGADAGRPPRREHHWLGGAQSRPDQSAAYRQQEERRALARARRNEVRRGWTRSGADWNDHYRDDVRRWESNDERRWNGRNDRSGWGAGTWDRGSWDRGGWDRNWRSDSRYDWAGWRAGHRSAFRLPRYYAPYGWDQGYTRFGVGTTLSSVLFAQNYWISEPWAYRLPEVDGGLRWVRYYNDALLVDTYSGEVVDVINDIFW